MRSRTAFLIAIVAALGGCDLAYPEVIVVNRTSEAVFLRNVSFNGCLWSTVLAYGDATSPAPCLPGKDRVHFQKLDTQAVCEEEDDGEPLWFNYQTVSIKNAGYGELLVVEITLDDMEQDFSAPSPYGH